jgi:hypothetical protein
MKRRTAEEVEREIAALDGLDRPALQQRWRDLYKTEPPYKIRSGFLRRAIAYRLQEMVYGGLKPQTLRILRRIAAEYRTRRGTAAGTNTGDGPPPRAPSRVQTLSPGTRLMREWNGSMESVEVVDDGFIWRDRSYRTLSAVAVAITGTKWSGPKFFGLLGTPRLRSRHSAGSSPESRSSSLEVR